MRYITVSIITSFLTTILLAIAGIAFLQTAGYYKNYYLPSEKSNLSISTKESDSHIISDYEKLELTINYINVYYEYQAKKISFATEMKCFKSGCVSLLDISLLNNELSREKSKIILMQEKLKNIYKQDDEGFESLNKLGLFNDNEL